MLYCLFAVVWCCGREVRQRSAKPRTSVRFRSAPWFENLALFRDSIGNLSFGKTFGEWPNGKASDSGSDDSRFES